MVVSLRKSIFENKVLLISQTKPKKKKLKKVMNPMFMWVRRCLRVEPRVRVANPSMETRGDGGVVGHPSSCAIQRVTEHWLIAGIALALTIYWVVLKHWDQLDYTNVLTKSQHSAHFPVTLEWCNMMKYTQTCH